MWYFDTKIKRCRQFYYGGCGGNENRFATEGECDQQCKQSDVEVVRTPPPARATEPPSRQTQAPTRRPTITRQRDNCLLEYASGNCGEDHRRYYFNRGYGICTQFLYTGCDGNENNFETLEECEGLCNDVVDLCDLQPLAGGCDENSTKWYFDAYTGRCHEFEFTGCYGNKNNFDDERSCMHACQHRREQETEATHPPTRAPQTRAPPTQRPTQPVIFSIPFN